MPQHYVNMLNSEGVNECTNEGTKLLFIYLLPLIWLVDKQNVTGSGFRLSKLFVVWLVDNMVYEYEYETMTYRIS